MEIYDNERDQVEALKRFFSEYGKGIIAIIVIIITALIGWHYWNDNAAKTARTDSLAYSNISQQLKTATPKAITATEKFASDNKNTYGALAALELARHFIDSKQPDRAITLLEQASGNTKDENLRALISLRLARIQIQQKQADAAIQILDSIKNKGWMALANDVRGDALLSKGDKAGARGAWTQALQNGVPEPLRNLIQIKIDNLSA